MVYPTNCFQENTTIGFILGKSELLTFCECCTNNKGQCRICNRLIETLNGQCGCDPTKVKLRERLVAFRKQWFVIFYSYPLFILICACHIVQLKKTN